MCEYLKISRLVIKEARKDENKKQILKSYLEQSGLNLSKMILVDEGWNCSSQSELTELFQGKSEGYYLGCFKESKSENIVLNGILFSGEGYYIPKYNGLFRSDLTLYEQICTAPSGLVIGYRKDKDGKIIPVEKIVDIEKKLYSLYTKEIQHYIIFNFRCLCAWSSNISKKRLSRYVLKIGLNGRISRVQKLQYYDNSYYENLTCERSSNSKERINRVRNISILNILKNPIPYFRYICKIRLLRLNNKGVNIIYPIFSKATEWYVSFFIR